MEGAIAMRRGEAHPVLERFEGNPILEPDLRHWWESKATFNPGAIYESGKVHILYRAIGDSDISVFGYASSVDGFHIDERLPEPAYVPREPFEGAGLLYSTPSYHQSSYMPEEYGESYVSGGGWGGCEDPRLTKIDDTAYMTYVAFDGYSPPRGALTSIHIDDFLAHNWRWKKPVLISAPGVVDKNACILPERINGKYVIFHRIYPHILIDFVDDLDFDGATRWLKGEFKIPPRASHWDSRKIGVGTPPIKTKEGWLLICQGVGERDPGRYKIGAMLLDLEAPTRVLSRSEEPILEPQAWYENEGWKSGVVYPCGAVVIEGRLLVYYGGADKVACVASVKLDELLDYLVGTREQLPSVVSAPPIAIPAPKVTAKKVTAKKVTAKKVTAKKVTAKKAKRKRELRRPQAPTEWSPIFKPPIWLF